MRTVLDRESMTGGASLHHERLWLVRSLSPSTHAHAVVRWSAGATFGVAFVARGRVKKVVGYREQLAAPSNYPVRVDSTGRVQRRPYVLGLLNQLRVLLEIRRDSVARALGETAP